MSSGNTTTYGRPSVSIGMGLDGNDYAYLTKQDKDSTGFFITFNVPFKRQDVFNELLNDDSQLGVDGTDTGLETVILKPGRESGKAVSSGCVRQTNYGSPVWGRTITELREIKAPAYIRWSTLMQDGTLFAFVGKADDNPKIQIALEELKKNSGTGVTITLDFVEAQDLLKASMESNLPKQWIESMTLRGYERADKEPKKKNCD